MTYGESQTHNRSLNNYMSFQLIIRFSIQSIFIKSKSSPINGSPNPKNSNTMDYCHPSITSLTHRHQTSLMTSTTSWSPPFALTRRSSTSTSTSPARSNMPCFAKIVYHCCGITNVINDTTTMNSGKSQHQHQIRFPSLWLLEEKLRPPRRQRTHEGALLTRL